MADKDQLVGALNITQRWKEFIAGYYARLFGAMLYTPNGDSMADDTLDAMKVSVVGTMGAVTVYNATGAAAIALSTTMAAAFRLLSVTLHLSAAPTTSQNFTVKVNANDGAAYDTTLLSSDLATLGATDLVYLPENAIFESGDEIDVAFTNTDTRTYGVRIVCEAV